MCHFCDALASTKEDAWPIWLATRFGGNRATIEAEIGSRTFSWKTSHPRIPVHCVCSDCNNGWMSDLENDAKPTIERLLSEERFGLGLVAQATVARWAVKTAMVLETFDRTRDPFYDTYERQSLRALCALPSRSWVWIAKCVEQPAVLSVAKHLRTSESAGAVHGFVTTMAFGTLALQVITIRVPDTVPTSTTSTIETREGPWGQVVSQVWPANSDTVVWPASVGLAGQEGLDALAERFSPPPRAHAV
jgi:hypothetical protein